MVSNYLSKNHQIEIALIKHILRVYSLSQWVRFTGEASIWLLQENVGAIEFCYFYDGIKNVADTLELSIDNIAGLCNDKVNNESLSKLDNLKGDLSYLREDAKNVSDDFETFGEEERKSGLNSLNLIIERVNLVTDNFIATSEIINSNDKSDNKK